MKASNASPYEAAALEAHAADAVRKHREAKTRGADVASISVQVSGAGEQVGRLLETLTMGGHRMRIEVKADSYKFQSFARIERWDGATWREMHTIIGACMKTEGAYSRGLTFATFATDRAELLRVATAILA